jgi:hypothetical protein
MVCVHAQGGERKFKLQLKIQMNVNTFTSWCVHHVKEITFTTIISLNSSLNLDQACDCNHVHKNFKLKLKLVPLVKEITSI